jgi:UDP-N-acetylmuramate-alanine ligase
MGSLALLAKELGYEVSGCDFNTYPPMSDLLQNQDIDLITGYDVKDLPKADSYVIGNALSRGNPLIEEILNKKKNYISGPDWIYQNVLKERRVIAVSGTHGKTTTTSMIAWILEDLGYNPGYLVAGNPKNFGKSSSLGSKDIFVIEADEYDTAFFDKRAKFIHYRPEVLVINNLEFDHADIYQDLEQIKIQFHHLVRSMSSNSSIVTPTNNKAIDEVLSMGLWSNLVQYGSESESKYFLKNLNDDFSKHIIFNSMELKAG